MKLAFPELTWLEPPSRGKLINELRHGGPVYEKPVFLPQSCRRAPPAGKRCATTGGLRSSQTCTAECFRSRAEVFFARWHSCCFRSWAFCCSRFCCVGRREGVHH